MYEGYADDFKVGYELALQQKGSRFRDHVTFVAPVKGDGAQVIDHLLPFEADIGGDDIGDTKLDEADFLPRWAFPITIRKAIVITTTDRLSMLADPSNAIVQSMWMAHRRAMDDKIIIPSMFRDVTAGKDKDQTVAFPAAQKVLSTVGANAGMNKTKVDAAFELLEKAEVDLDEEQPRMAISPRQHRNLRALAEVANEDFRKLGGVIEKGRVKEFLGFIIVISNKLLKKAGTNLLRCPVWVPSGVAVQPWMDPRVRISERPDKNYVTQVWAECRYGAIRTEEGRVVEVECDETFAA